MPTAPYDMLSAVVNTARVRLNDAIASISGDILTDNAAFTGAAINAAWRRLQELLANYGLPIFNREVIYASVPLITSADLGVRVWFNWVNYWDGTGLQAAPVFPQDMICPLELFERAHAGGTNYIPMDQVYSGLPTAPKLTLNKLWEWRQETIYMPGATVITDLMMRYQGFLADLNVGLQTSLSGGMTAISGSASVVSGANIANGYYIQIDTEYMLVTAGGGTGTLTVTRGQLGTTGAIHAIGANVYVSPVGIPVPIMRCLNPFAWLICSEMAKARGDLDAGAFDQQAFQAAEFIYNRDTRQPRSLYKGSELGKMTDQHTPTKGPAGPRGPQKE